MYGVFFCVYIGEWVYFHYWWNWKGYVWSRMCSVCW